MILVIDDSEEDRYFLKRLIWRVNQNFEILEFAYADSALDYLTDQDDGLIDTIFLDLNMPKFSGFDFLKSYRTRKRQIASAPRLYVVSGSIDPYERTVVEVLPEVSGYHSKPLKLEDIAQCIAAG